MHRNNQYMSVWKMIYWVTALLFQMNFCKDMGIAVGASESISQLNSKRAATSDIDV